MRDEELVKLKDDCLIDLSYKGYLFLEKVSAKEAIKIIGLSASGHPTYHIIPFLHGTVQLPHPDEKEPVYNSIAFLKKCFKK